MFLSFSFENSETEIQSNLSSQMFSISHNSVLNQLVQGKNVLVVEQNFGSWPDNPFLLIPVWLVTVWFGFWTNCFLNNLPEWIRFENRGSIIWEKHWPLRPPWLPGVNLSLSVTAYCIFIIGVFELGIKIHFDNVHFSLCIELWYHIQIFYLIFSSRCFIVVALAFCFIIHFEGFFFLVYGVT